MPLKKLVLIFAISYSCSLFAIETDQFTLPPQSLNDVGPRISLKLFETLQAIETRNPQADDDARKFFFEKWGQGVPTNHIENWLNFDREFSSQDRYQVQTKDSIYAEAQPAIMFFFLAPTINMYGVYLGTDKLGHLAQQGYEYFQIFQNGLRRGLSPLEAQNKAVASGVWQEQTYFGTGIDGVYSNGDLSGNFAGLKFYRNFFEEIKFGNQTLAPFFSRVSGKLKLNSSLKPELLLRAYITPYLNEAINASKYLYSKSEIGNAVKERCAMWQRRGLIPSHEYFETLKTFYGENYGFNQGIGVQITLEQSCR